MDPLWTFLYAKRMIATSWIQDKIMIQPHMFQSAFTAMNPGTNQTAQQLKILEKNLAKLLIMTMNTVLLQEMLANGSVDAALELRMTVKTPTQQTRMGQPLTKLCVAMICATLWTHLAQQDQLILLLILPADHTPAPF